MQCSPPCKSKINDSFINRAKKSLRNVISSPDVAAASDPLGAFSEALVNLHSHYCLDNHTSEWCKYHSKVSNTHTSYMTNTIIKFIESSGGRGWNTIQYQDAIEVQGAS